MLAAAEEAGLDVKAAQSFLDTDELRSEVCQCTRAREQSPTESYRVLQSPIASHCGVAGVALVWRHHQREGHPLHPTVRDEPSHSPYADRQLDVGWRALILTSNPTLPRSFVFNCPQLSLVGGPFRNGPGTPWVLNGSMDAPTFLQVFEAAYSRLQRAPTLLGRRVALRELQSRPELNGQEGMAMTFDEAKGRYGVHLEGSGTVLALKPDNLTAAASIPPTPPTMATMATRATATPSEGREQGSAEATICDGGACCAVECGDDDDGVIAMF